MSCTRLRILLNTICRKPGFNSLRTPLNHGAEQASNETLKQTQQRNWSNASQGGQTALKEDVAVLHYETASTTHQPRGEHRGTIKDCKIAGATTWQGQGNHTFTTIVWWDFAKLNFPLSISTDLMHACGECMITLSLPRSGACNLAILNCAPVFAPRLLRCACGLGMQYCQVFF